MLNKHLVIAVLLCYGQLLTAQSKVVTTDIAHFFEAFDSVQTTSDKSRQLNFINNLYVARASKGLQIFVEKGGANPEKWLRFMLFKKNWLTEMRPYMLAAATQMPEIESKIKKLKTIYPAFQDGDIYFIVGVGFIGGTAFPDQRLFIIGTEVSVEKNDTWAAPKALHEFVHLQQKSGNQQLMTQCIYEGMADFISEYLYGKNLAKNGYARHIAFGQKREKEIWKIFKEEMWVTDNGYLGWLYAGQKIIKGKKMNDLGYFMGYRICKSYYDQSKDKTKALQEMLQLDFTSNEVVKGFILKSGYVPEKEVNTIRAAGFTSTKPANTAPEVIFGYKETQVDIIFHYTVDPMLTDKIPIETVSVAGGFNDWNPGNEEFQMLNKGNFHYELVVPKSKLQKGKVYEFKFVVNGEMWIETPANAKNVLRNGQYGNLTVVF